MFQEDKENINNININPLNYIPGDVTEPKHRLPSYNELLIKNSDKPTSPKFPKIKDDFSKPTPELAANVSKEVEDFCTLNKGMIDIGPKNVSSDCKKKGRLLSPILAAISNFNLAKKLHRENLEHNPLPDTITDRMYRKLQMRRQEEPGLSLEDQHFATGMEILT